MELKLSKELTCKSEIRDKQICLLSIIFEVETAEINFQKLSG